MYEDENNQEPDLIEITDEDGNVYQMEIIDYFFYNGQEYAIIADYDEEDEQANYDEDVDCFIMQVNTVTDENGDELDEFVPIEDEELENRLIAVAHQRLSEDEDADEEKNSRSAIRSSYQSEAAIKKQQRACCCFFMAEARSSFNALFLAFAHRRHWNAPPQESCR